MKRKLFIVFFIIAAFIGSFGLAQYFDQNRLLLPLSISQSMYWFESLFEQESALPDDSHPHKQVVKGQMRKHTYQHI